MKKYRIAFVLGALAAAILFCSIHSLGSAKKTPVIPNESAPTTDPVPNHGFNIQFKAVEGYATSAEKRKIKAAEKAVNETVQSKCFADFMNNRNMIETNGKFRAEVVEDLQTRKDTIPVSMYYRCMKFGIRCVAPTSAVAYRQPPSKTINLNRAAFSVSDSDCDWASTMMHETSHVFGYTHSFKWTPERDYTVPYSINKIFTACCGKP